MAGSSGVPKTPSIPTQDLDAHHGPILAALEAAAVRAIRSGRYILGPEVQAFEDELAAAYGIRHGVGLSSGTDAILAILMALGVGPGDEVVTTPFSFFATVGAIVRLGARPVFADVDPLTMNLDDSKAAERIRPHTKAVMTVHLFGRVAPTAEIEKASVPFGIPLVEDAAQAIGARERGTGRLVGAIGRAAALSFFPSKNLGGFGDAGMAITNDTELADRLRLVRAHGARPKYHHEIIGGNFRLDELQAALLRVKLPRLASWANARRRVAGWYAQRLVGLPSLKLPPIDDAGCVWNQYVVRVPHGRRDAMAKALGDEGIATAVYYPEPLHTQPCFSGLGYREGDFPEAEGAAREALALPMYPELPESSVDRVADTIRRFVTG